MNKEGDYTVLKWRGKEAIRSPLQHAISLPTLAFLNLMVDGVVHPTILETLRGWSAFWHEIYVN